MAKFCSNCGTQLEDGVSFCSNCGTPTNSSERQSFRTNNSFNYDKESEGAPTWLKIVSFLFPIIGFVLYFVYKSENKKKASDCAKFAWIGFAVNFVIICLSAA